ncbi:uncharacterized protein LOC103784895 [Pan paniscus]|uniref:uncharacterized protein LOC103784895 n=1 Tax=Pan paniscus TaxID=9597 RepID=UPI003006FB9B
MALYLIWIRSRLEDGASVPGADLPWSAWARRAHRPLGPRVRLRLRLGVSKGTCAASWGRGGPKASGQCALSPWGGERECPWESRRAPPRVPSNPTRKRGPHSGLQQSPRPRPCLKSRPLHLSSSGPASSPGSLPPATETLPVSPGVQRHDSARCNHCPDPRGSSDSPASASQVDGITVAKIAGLYNDSEPPRKTMRRGVLMTLLQQSAMTLPLWIGKPGDKPPPLCGANLASGDYVTRPGDKVAARVKAVDGDEQWILAEVVSYSHTTKYEVDDIDEEGKERHSMSWHRIILLLQWKVNPETP